MTSSTALTAQGTPPGGNGLTPDGRGGGRFEPVPLGVPLERSSYLESLPGVYQDNDFLCRFLLIFEHILSPLDRTAGSLASFFDASLTPSEFLPWLGSWIGLVIDQRMPEQNRRELLRAAPDLFRWRGTRRGLREFLLLSTGIEPEIIEPSLSEIASNPNLAFRFTVRMRVPAGTELPRSYVETIVEAEKPAFAGCTIEIVGQ
jgi:phage tail-like protein